MKSIKLSENDVSYNSFYPSMLVDHREEIKVKYDATLQCTICSECYMIGPRF